MGSSYVILTSSQKSATTSTANALGVPVEWLLAVVQHESAGNPKAKNPSSSARGLIQFIDSTAKTLGYNSSLDLVGQNPSYEMQMTGPVHAYFRKYAPFPTFASFAGAVFYPEYRNKPLALLPAKVRAVNPFQNIQEYADRVWNRYKGIKVVETSLIPLALLAGGIWWYVKRGRLRTRV